MTRQVSTSERRPAVGLGRRRLPKLGGQGKVGLPARLTFRLKATQFPGEPGS